MPSVPHPEPMNLSMKPIDVAHKLSHLPGMVFFDSSGNLPKDDLTPISIIAAQPERLLEGSMLDEEDFQELQNTIALKKNRTKNGALMPSQATCGWVEYEGKFCFGLYSRLMIFEHATGQWWQCGNLYEHFRENEKLAPVQIGKFHANMSREDYLKKVRKIHDYIAAGDIYQVNLTQRFTASVQGGSLFPLYKHLRKKAPAPMSAWISLAGKEILCSSPETFLKMKHKHIETRPIKGTRPRFSIKKKDDKMLRDLIESEKEKAELIMITDLERNDLGKVCEFGSVKVQQMLALEKLEHVHHMVSTVVGTLRDDLDHLRALRECFPGGSITGAPKKRAMEIIRELEVGERGLYTGAIGYIGSNGHSQFNIPIRTLIREKKKLHYQVGAGIVADSDPSSEYQETLDKAKGIRTALKSFLT